LRAARACRPCDGPERAVGFPGLAAGRAGRVAGRPGRAIGAAGRGRGAGGVGRGRGAGGAGRRGRAAGGATAAAAGALGAKAAAAPGKGKFSVRYADIRLSCCDIDRMAARISVASLSAAWRIASASCLIAAASFSAASRIAVAWLHASVIAAARLPAMAGIWPWPLARAGARGARTGGTGADGWSGYSAGDGSFHRGHEGLPGSGGQSGAGGLFAAGKSAVWLARGPGAGPHAPTAVASGSATLAGARKCPVVLNCSAANLRCLPGASVTTGPPTAEGRPTPNLTSGVLI
jgi:hypothetical protein